MIKKFLFTNFITNNNKKISKVVMIRRRRGKNCVMGCSSAKVHTFPRDPKRREEWCRILGVFPRQKNAFICSAHFSNCYINGRHLSRYAIPNPPESRTQKPSDSGLSNAQEITNIIKSASNEQTNENSTKNISTEKSRTKNLSHSGLSDAQEIMNIIKSISKDTTNENRTRNSEMDYDNSVEEKIVTENSAYDYENIDDLLSSTEVVIDDTTQKNNHVDDHKVEEFDINQDGKIEAKVEEFEMRKRSTNDMIIKGRYVETNDYLLVAYTPPRKWSLQEQIKRLDTTCHTQLRQIKQLNKENERLRREMRKYESVLRNMRELQTKNRYLMAELKLYKLEEARLKRKRRKDKLKKEEIVKEEGDIIPE